MNAMRLLPSGTRRSRRLALITLIATTLLLVAAGLIVRTTRWDTPVFPGKSPGSVSVGPFNAGEAFEQNLVVPVDHLSSLTIQVRTPEGQRTGPAATLIFRLYDGDQIVRQGLVSIPNLDHVIQRVVWSFVPIPSTANIEHRLQVVVGDETKASVNTMASITNKWPGSLVSNGIPTADHIDLAIEPGRELSATQIVLGAAARAPINLVGIALSIVAATAAFGAGVLTSLRLPKSYPRSAAGLLVGLTAAVLHVAIASGQFGGSPSPELTSTFWIWILISLMMLSRLPWAIVLIGLSTTIFHITMTLRAFREIHSPELTSEFWLWLLLPIGAVGFFPWVVAGIAWIGHLLLPAIWANRNGSGASERYGSVLDPRRMDKWRNRGTSAVSRVGWGVAGIIASYVQVFLWFLRALLRGATSTVVRLRWGTLRLLTACVIVIRLARREWRSITLSVVCGITVAAFILVALGESEPLIQTVQGLDEGRAPHARFGLFNRSQPETTVRMAMIGWLTFGAAVLTARIAAWTRAFLSE
jgi:hypothetical protein